MLRSNAGLILLLLCNASTAALQGTCDLPTKQGFSQQDSQQAKPHRSRQPELRDGGALRAAALELRGLLKDARTASAALSSAALELHGLLQAADAAALALDTAAARQDSALQAASGHTTAAAAVLHHADADWLQSGAGAAHLLSGCSALREKRPLYQALS